MQSTLLLSSSYEPIDVIDWKDAIRLMVLEKADLIEEYNKEIRSMYLTMKLPAVIRLVSSFKKSKKSLRFSRINIYTRDKYTCQYCSMKGGMKEFTFDHVVPKSKGGKTCWINIVTCCRPCNTKKRDITPREAGMELLKTPIVPKWLPCVIERIARGNVPQQWSPYLQLYS